MMDEPAVAYMANRAPQLGVAMVVGSAITMPRTEGALRGSVAAQSMAQSMPNAAAATGPLAPAAASATAVAVIAAAT